VSYHLRKRALQNDMTQYTCCAGHMARPPAALTFPHARFSRFHARARFAHTRNPASRPFPFSAAPPLQPCSGRFGEHSCPELCLGVEVACCFANSVVSTRYLIQDTMIVQNTECDNCLVGFLVAMEQLACSARPARACAACVRGVRCVCFRSPSADNAPSLSRARAAPPSLARAQSSAARATSPARPPSRRLASC
jgi:hypothetical protein